MTYVLLNRATNALTQWPRDDNQPLVGMDRAVYHVLEVVREQAPDDFDPATHWAQPLAPVVSVTDPDAEINGTLVYGWEVVELAPVIIPPNWSEFGNAILYENGYVAAQRAAASSSDGRVAFAADGIFLALYKFQSTGDFADYLTALALVISAAENRAELVEEFFELAQRCHLPAAFITAFQQAIIPPSNSE